MVRRASLPIVGPAVGEDLRVAVTSPPVDGAANAAVIDAVADVFRSWPAAVRSFAGEQECRKTVRMSGALSRRTALMQRLIPTVE